MYLSSRIEITSNSTTSGPRSARLIITGEGNEVECQKALDFLFRDKESKPKCSCCGKEETKLFCIKCSIITM